MLVKTNHSGDYKIYYCTFTCYNWLPLFEISNAYQAVYRWFEVLRTLAVDVTGYVIMPNHLHCLLHFNADFFSVSKTIGNGKRFIAYEIIRLLKDKNEIEILTKLGTACTQVEKRKGQLHKVFKASFDARPVFTDKFLQQKLHYIHSNRVPGKWNFVSDLTSYEHSSCSFYQTGRSRHFTPVHFNDL